MAKYNEAVNITLKHEGGYVNDRQDPGGETKYGISKRQYPNINIEKLTIDEAVGIYNRDYWNKLKCGEITDQELANQLFDFGVNVGVYKAAKTIQRVVSVHPDGNIGPVTLNAIEEYLSKTDTLIYRFRDARIIHYMNICKRKKVMRKFLYAWIKRTI